MVDKGDLGVGYLIGTGAGLLIIVSGYLLFINKNTVDYWLGAILIVILGLTLVFVGFWLRKQDLSDDHAWRVAVWGAVGFTVPTLAVFLITIVRIQLAVRPLLQSLFIVFIATGGVVGVLLSSIIQLSEEHSTTRTLAQRTSVLNRVLRHNIRNDMNVILGYAARLRSGDGTREEIADGIESTGRSIIDLSESIRRVGHLESKSQEPINLVTLIRERVVSARSTFPEATISVDLPDEAWVKADTLLPLALDNLFNNAITHNDADEPKLHISVEVESSSNSWVEIRVEDNGPGIPDRELDVLDEGAETALQHSSGIGLWTVKWFVETNGGELAFETCESEGTEVIVKLPGPSDST